MNNASRVLTFARITSLAIERELLELTGLVGLRQAECLGVWAYGRPKSDEVAQNSSSDNSTIPEDAAFGFWEHDICRINAEKSRSYQILGSKRELARIRGTPVNHCQCIKPRILGLIDRKMADQP